ncbi:MAG TPA: ABC transporter permease [Gemmatimonadaceae bacterium]|nr:ABC transporter permease [Gemmatimonadaceae bacterium]
MLDSFLHDARHALRGFVRGPVFTLTAILSLAIGIGATTAIFSLVDTLLLSTPPGIGAPERLVNVGRTQNGNGFDNMSWPNFVDYRDRNRTLSGLAALQFETRAVSLAGPDGGEALQGSIVSGNFFEVLQARPALGRFFLPEEDRTPRSHPVVVLNHAFWRERFNGDSAIVGRGLVLNGSPFTVVGVAAEGFHGPMVLAPDVWAPVMSAPLLGLPDDVLTSRASVWLMAIGRLAPEVGLTQAQADLSAIANQLEQSFAEVNRGQGVRLAPATLFPGDFQGIVNAFMAFLFALAGLVLLVAATNVAGMLLARAAARRREIAVRLAIGASRRRLLQQLLTESTLLFLIAGAAGAVLARWLVTGLIALVPRLPVQLGIEPQIDWRVLTFAIAVSLVAGLLAGLAPALQSTRPALAPELRGDASGAGGGTRQRLRSGLLVAQMAFSTLLVVIAALFSRALVQARAIDPGFDPRGVQIATLDFNLANQDEEAAQRFAATLLERAAMIPGAEGVAMSRMLPLDGGGFGLGSIEVPGRPAPDPERGWIADWNIVTPGYFDVMRIPLVSGRVFNDADRAGATDVAIINQTLAERIWPGEDPVGKTFINDERPVTVIGVARDAKYRSLGEPKRGFVYVPLTQRYHHAMSLLVRGVPGAALAAPIRRLVAELNPALPILSAQTMETHAAIGLFPQRIALIIAGSLGAVALLLAVLGIYGVTAYGVARRTREIGIRIALGSPRVRVQRLVLRQGVVLAGIGVTLGLVAALAVARLLESLLYGVPGTDPLALGGAAVVLVLAALAASWIPARRAARVDPVVALRTE